MDLILIAWIRVEVGCLQAESEQICFEVSTTYSFKPNLAALALASPFLESDFFF